MNAEPVSNNRKRVLSTRRPPGHHWVGDGFPVHSLFGYSGEGVAERSPFLLLDYAAPTLFPATTHRRGVGSHPHRGFETVSIVFEGEVEHRDSTGAGGVIRSGDVQRMTAGSGILHEEFHSADYAARGGPFEVMQLWVNLPAVHKMTPARYQSISAPQIPVVNLPEGGGTIRVIAGEHAGTPGAARTFSPMNVLDVRLAKGHTLEIPQPEGWSTLVAQRTGSVRVNGDAGLQATDLATLSRSGTGLIVEAISDAALLLLAGEPIEEPVVGYGPFVMNTEQQIREAIADFNRGQFGRLS